MASSTEQLEAPYEAEVELAENVSASLEGSTVQVKGPLGVVQRDFSKIPVTVSLGDRKLQIRSSGRKKKDLATLNTARSIIKSLVTGVSQGFTYKLKVVFAHFPVSVKVKGKEVHVENFYGERSPRVAKIVGDCKVTVEGDDVVVRGVSVEDAGQTAANIQEATRVKRKDQRVFLDGIYVYDKKVG